ncbi:MAG: hypothetical protein ABIN94_08595 [Ferruginibacter sp.]
MKKIFTFLLAAGAISVTYAQPGSRTKPPFKNNGAKYSSADHGRVNVQAHNNVVTYATPLFSLKQKQMLVQSIENRYQQRMLAVHNNSRLRNREKLQQIRMLEIDRRKEISEVEFRFDKANSSRQGFAANQTSKWNNNSVNNYKH